MKKPKIEDLKVLAKRLGFKDADQIDENFVVELQKTYNRFLDLAAQECLKEIKQLRKLRKNVPL